MNLLNLQARLRTIPEIWVNVLALFLIQLVHTWFRIFAEYYWVCLLQTLFSTEFVSYWHCLLPTLFTTDFVYSRYGFSTGFVFFTGFVSHPFCFLPTLSMKWRNTYRHPFSPCCTPHELSSVSVMGLIVEKRSNLKVLLERHG